MIFTTAYTSRMRPLPDDGLSDLLERSRTRNAEWGITGLLMYRDGKILQMLEGPEGAVRDLYDRIASDVRHHHVTNVWTSTSQRRRFPDWSMGFDDLRHPQGRDTAATTTGPRASDTQTGRDPSAGLDASTFDHDLSIAYVRRRDHVLRRALATGDRMTTALAIILNGHDPEDVAGANGVEPHLRCRVCTPSDDAVLDAYPCATAKNAIWALEAAGPGWSDS